MEGMEARDLMAPGRPMEAVEVGEAAAEGAAVVVVVEPFTWQRDLTSAAP